MAERNEALFEAVKSAYRGIDEKFGTDISVLKISNISILADYFILATAGSINQARAIADEAERRLRAFGIALRHIEDSRGSKWLLMDFGTIIVHLFVGEERQFYNLDAVWRDADVIEME